MHTASPRTGSAREADSGINWEAVYRQSLPKVYRYFSCWVGDGSLAEDLTSATFEKAWSSRGSFSLNKGTGIGWLLGIAKNVKAAYFRNERQVGSLDEATKVATSHSVEESVQLKAEFDHLFQLLQQIGERERELIALKYGAELTNRQISKMTGLSETNVGTILHRVVRQLRTQWEETQ